MKPPARDVAKSAGMYFGYFLALGSLLPFISLFYSRLGLTGVQIGILVAIPVLVLSSTTLIWGALSDAFRLHRWLLSLAFLLAPFAALLISRSTTFESLVVAVLAYAVFTSPILPLLDSLALEVATVNGSSYGGMRLWGSVGWSVSTLVVGALIERNELRIFFYCYAFFLWSVFFLSLFQPRRKPAAPGVSRKPRLSTFARFDLLIFLASVFLLALTSSAVNAFFSLYMDGIGAGAGLIGLAWAISSLSEIPVFLVSGRLIQRFGASGLLNLAFFVYTLRWLLFSFIQQPGLALLVQLLHGLAFASFLAGSVTYIHERVPEHLGATAQALLSTVTFGLGAIAGSLYGGFAYDRFGTPLMFRTLSLIALAGFLVFWLGNLTIFPIKRVGVAYKEIDE